MPQDAGVETEVPDLGGLTLAELIKQDDAAFAETLRSLMDRIDQPSQSISGYNPQRLD
jgi:hypothetical protein